MMGPSQQENTHLKTGLFINDFTPLFKGVVVA